MRWISINNWKKKHGIGKVKVKKAPSVKKPKRKISESSDRKGK